MRLSDRSGGLFPNPPLVTVMTARASNSMDGTRNPEPDFSGPATFQLINDVSQATQRKKVRFTQRQTMTVGGGDANSGEERPFPPQRPWGLTWQSSQHRPCAQTAPGLRVQLVALQQRFVHSWGGKGPRRTGSQGATAGGSKEVPLRLHEGREPAGLALELQASPAGYLRLQGAKPWKCLGAAWVCGALGTVSRSPSLSGRGRGAGTGRLAGDSLPGCSWGSAGKQGLITAGLPAVKGITRLL